MNTSPNLKLNWLLASQSDKHVTYNEAMLMLDALVQLSVESRSVAAPPSNPTYGDKYIVGNDPTSEWLGQAHNVAIYHDTSWRFFTPQPGWLAWVKAEGCLVVFAGTQWNSHNANIPFLGINTSADSTNKLAVAAPASLFSHDGADHRLKINKASEPKTASVLYQSGWSGRAEAGLNGSDGYSVKVSPDGVTWVQALEIDGQTGCVSLLKTTRPDNLLLNGSFGINQRGFSGGALAAGLYGYDRWKAGSGGANLMFSSGVVNLVSGQIIQIVEAPNVAGSKLTLSVQDLSGGALTVVVGGQTGQILPGSGRRDVTLTINAVTTGNLTVSLSPTGGAVSFANVNLVRGSRSGEWSPRLPHEELAGCQRYFEKGTIYLFGWPNANATAPRLPTSFSVTKAKVPTISFTATTYYAASGVAAPLVTTSGFSYGVTTDGSGNSAGFQSTWLADAEL
jgi:Protein of unknown function (DUF2793)